MENLSNFKNEKEKVEQVEGVEQHEEKSFEELEALANNNKCYLVMDYIENFPVVEERKELFNKMYNSNEVFKKFLDDAKDLTNSTLKETVFNKIGIVI